MKVLLSFSFVATSLLSLGLLISGNVSAYSPTHSQEEAGRNGAVVAGDNQTQPVENFDERNANNARMVEQAHRNGARIGAPSGGDRPAEFPVTEYTVEDPPRIKNPFKNHQDSEVSERPAVGAGDSGNSPPNGQVNHVPPQVGRPQGAAVTRGGGARDPNLYRTQEEIDLDAAVADCQSSAEKAEFACATDKDGHMKSTMDWIDMGTQIGTMITKGTGSIQLACSNLAKALDKASAGLAAIKTVCGIAAWNCSRQCTAQVASVSPASISKCKLAGERVRGIEVQIATLVSQKMDAKQCQDQSKSSVQIFCEKNPGAAACANLADFDCSNPKNGAQLICKCQLPSSANLPECGGMISRGTGAGGGAGDTTATSASSEQAMREAAKAAAQARLLEELAGKAGLGGPGKSDGAGMDATAQSGGSKGVSASTGDGKGGGAGGRGPGGTRLNTNVNSGSYGGSGGGGFGGGGGGRGGGTFAGNARFPSGDPQERFDPNKYLPTNGQVRRVSGMTGPDGITGPADNIFSKINNRYRAVGSGLNP